MYSFSLFEYIKKFSFENSKNNSFAITQESNCYFPFKNKKMKIENEGHVQSSQQTFDLIFPLKYKKNMRRRCDEAVAVWLLNLESLF